MKKIKSIVTKYIHGTAADSIVLTFVKVVTAVLGLAVTKLMAVNFSLTEYGTYSQGMLIVTTATSLSIFGLTNAVNYYYNAKADEKEKEAYVSTIFTLQYIIGLVVASIIIIGNIPIIKYFNNESLKNVIFFAAWLPLMNNLLHMLQVLFVSVGKAKLIAVRNFVLSVLRLIVVAIACYLVKNIVFIFILTLCLDIIQILYFTISFEKIKFKISVRKFNKSYLKPILIFSIPMAVYVLTNELSRDIDKYIISFFSDTETLGIYSNAAKVLPFDMITASFFTVLVPIITRQVSARNNEEAKNTFKSYLRLGYLTTWIIVSGVIVNAKEAMLFLYDDKYISGLPVFIVYLVVDMIKFASTPLILTAKGKTKTLMICSISALAVNFVLNILGYKLFGIIGPAVVTFIVTFGLIIALLILGAREIKCSVFAFFDFKEMLLIIAEMLSVGTACYFLKGLLYRYISSYFIVMAITFCLYFAVVFGLNFKKLLSCLKNIGKLK